MPQNLNMVNIRELFEITVQAPIREWVFTDEE